MEKKLKGKTFTFRDSLKMWELQNVQKIFKDLKDETIDSMQTNFECFVILCTHIEGKEQTDEEKLKYIRNMENLDLFNELDAIMSDLVGKFLNIDEKKKTA